MPVEWHCRHCRLRPASWCLSPLSLPPPRRTKSQPHCARDVSTSRQRVRRHQPSQPVPPPEIGRTRKTALLGSTGQRRLRELQGALHQTAPRAVDRPITPNESRVSCAARHRTGSSGHRVRGLETTTSVSMPRYRGRGGRGRGLETTALAPMPRCLADSRPRPRHQCRPHLGNRGRGLETTASVSMPRCRGRGGRGRGLVSGFKTAASASMLRYRGRGGQGRGLKTTALASMPRYRGRGMRHRGCGHRNSGRELKTTALVSMPRY